MLCPVADALDPRQLAELREVQRLIRHARSDAAGEFTWCRGTHTSSPAAHTVSAAGTEPLVGNLTQVVRGICAAIAEGELQAGDSISARRIARRSGVSPGRVADALAHLAEEALIDRHAGHYLLPVPTPRDVIETYTARGLLGTAIVRRLASDRIDMPKPSTSTSPGSSAATNSDAPTRPAQSTWIYRTSWRQRRICRGSDRCSSASPSNCDSLSRFSG